MSLLVNRLLCWFLGHRWTQFDVSWISHWGDPQTYLNDFCHRCGEPRNPYIWTAQRVIIEGNFTGLRITQGYPKPKTNEIPTQPPTVAAKESDEAKS